MTAPVFAPSTALEVLVHRGDVEGTLAWLRPLSEAERRRHGASVARMVRLMWESGWRDPKGKSEAWGARSTDAQDRAAAVAVLLCGTAAQAAEARLRVEDIVALAREFTLPCLPGLADALLARGTHAIRVVQELIAAGVIARPDSEAYTIGLMALPRCSGRGVTLADHFAADPGLVDAVWRLFDVQGTAEDSLASTDKYQHGSVGWTSQLLALAQDGTLPRARLLERTLSVLARDWPQYRAGWFSRFHDALAPSVDELRANAPLYLRLCRSRIPPTVSLALEALARLEAAAAIDATALVPALRPVFATGTKGQVEAALKLLARAVAGAPTLAAEAACIATAALVHDAPALQAKLLKAIAPQATDGRVRAELERHVDGIAASNRARLLALLGRDDAPAREVHGPGSGTRADADASSTPPPPSAPTVSTASNAPTEPTEPMAPTAPERRLDPPATPDALVELVAHVFENDDDVDAWEMAVAGLVAAAPVRGAALAGFAPVRKRVPRLRTPLARELGRLLEGACGGERTPPQALQDRYGKDSRVHRQLNARIDDLVALAARGHGLVPLSTPTHRRGVIAAAELVARLQAHRRAGVESSPGEQTLAILRVDAAAIDDAGRAALRALPEDPFARALRYALGDDVAPAAPFDLFLAAARIRHPRADDPALLARCGDTGPDGARAAGYRWEVTTRTSDGPPAWTHHDLVMHTEPPAPVAPTLLAVSRHAPPPERTSWGGWMRQFVAGENAAVIAYSATVMPSDLEPFFAEGAREFGNNLDWWEARWHAKAYLQPLLDPTVRPGAMGLLLLALALSAKEPGQSALAADALARLHGEHRLDAVGFAQALRRLLATPLAKAARLRRSLEAALRIEPGLAATVVDVLLAALPQEAAALPRDTAKLLELLHELMVAGARRPDAAERTRLSALKAAAGAAVARHVAAIERLR